ncbi:MAG: 2Fe-2S iron-sulfur cluster-binding protein [Chloroflexi bacterium]|nr:2Fe-2S iron-sulfur cluster-binding protein [Chloroflexota bacterium]
MAEPQPTATRPVRFRVHRRKAGDDGGRYDSFEVQLDEQRTVLDGLVAIRTEQDPSLTFRHSCFHASCGTCGMRVNGADVLACVTKVAELGTEVTVEPLANIPLVSDLVVDMGAFYGAEGIDVLTRYEDCIECGICVSACPVAGSDPRYAGPAALCAAGRVVEEPRDADRTAALRFADGAHGVWRCHVAYECTEACPSAADPAGHIMRLRRAATAERFRRWFGAGRAAR